MRRPTRRPDLGGRLRMAALLVLWALLCLALPCLLGFMASYHRKGRRMLVLIGAVAVFCILMIAGIYSEMLAAPQDQASKAYAAIYAMLLTFGGGGAALGLLVGGLAGWMLRGRL